VLQNISGTDRNLPVAAFAYVAAGGDTNLEPWVWDRDTKSFVNARRLSGVVDVYRAGVFGEPFVGATVDELLTALPDVAQATVGDISGAVNTALINKLSSSIADQRIADVLRRKLPPE